MKKLAGSPRVTTATNLRVGEGYLMLIHARPMNPGDLFCIHELRDTLDGLVMHRISGNVSSLPPRQHGQFCSPGVLASDHEQGFTLSPLRLTQICFFVMARVAVDLEHFLGTLEVGWELTTDGTITGHHAHRHIHTVTLRGNLAIWILILGKTR